MSEPDHEVPETAPEQERYSPADADAPYFNIGAVARVTNIQEATLRVWERRYDFPHATRTSGGHRLYSQHDIMRLKWVKYRVEEGMQVSKAIQALYHAERENVGHLLVSPREPARTASDTSLAQFYKQLVSALLAHDSESANRLLSDATILFSLEQVIYDVISPTLAEIGEAWHDGTIDVATEHYATNLIRHTLFAWMRTPPPAYNVSPVVLTCAPNELHEGSLLMLAILLQRLRWPVVYLGQSMPLSDLQAFLEAVKPSIMVFVAMSVETAHSLAQWPHYLPKVAQTGAPVVGYGGRAFSEYPELAQQIQGQLLGNTLQEGVTTLNRLLHELNPFLR